ncbi:MAG TPA: helix-turn-helix domain-containing protein [Acidimicrobiales bacterium]|nr:helix-turn-helix domain-containing protein [Acidimicrobiales bacterium]
MKAGSRTRGPVGPAAPTCRQVIEEAAAVFGVTTDELCGHGLSGRVIAARQTAMYVCHLLVDEPLRAIGRSFGGRDDATVLAAARRVDRLMAERPAIRGKVAELTNRLGRVHGRRAG